MDEQRKPKEIKRGKNGMPIPGPGLPKGFKPDPLKKARKQLIEEYKDALAEALPLVSPALIKKAVQGDVSAIRELNDVIVEKAGSKIKHEGEIKITPILGGLTNKENDEN